MASKKLQLLMLGCLVSPAVLKVLVEQFGLGGITTVEEDLQKMIG